MYRFETLLRWPVLIESNLHLAKKYGLPLISYSLSHSSLLVQLMLTYQHKVILLLFSFRPYLDHRTWRGMEDCLVTIPSLQPENKLNWMPVPSLPLQGSFQHLGIGSCPHTLGFKCVWNAPSAKVRVCVEGLGVGGNSPTVLNRNQLVWWMWGDRLPPQPLLLLCVKQLLPLNTYMSHSNTHTHS